MVALVEMLLLIILNESHMLGLVTTGLRQRGDIKTSKPVEKQKSPKLLIFFGGGNKKIITCNGNKKLPQQQDGI